MLLALLSEMAPDVIPKEKVDLRASLKALDQACTLAIHQCWATTDTVWKQQMIAWKLVLSPTLERIKALTKPSPCRSSQGQEFAVQFLLILLNSEFEIPATWARLVAQTTHTGRRDKFTRIEIGMLVPWLWLPS
jgi:hypothetical protein